MAFFIAGERRKPLKHGIEKDIEAELTTVIARLDK
jgi:hypothetical protein